MSPRGLGYLFLSILSQVRSEALKVIIGHVGHRVTLPCAYDARVQGLVSFCWGRGKVPTFKCSNRILAAEDGEVFFISDTRYQLLGRVGDGNVSLTILNAQPSDAGVYGCRVELPGWFNDYKVNTYLVVEEVPSEQPVTQDNMHATAGTQKEGDDDTTKRTEQVEDELKAFHKVGNICRLAAIVSITVLFIPVFISWRRSCPRQHVTTSTVENIYQIV
uniref:hepatitis A virus cellular receptor 1 homolog isoform X2 n=1 Tax=Doryrhamphus excisus TaxID=161450 RepID=UPI0025ADF9EA|nr:hepatitis A virus cellular receptor 1 homolog isoform X2 [Doryrhamphus excisus]